MNKTTAELAEIVGGQLYGDPTHIISDVKGSRAAGNSHVTFAQGIYLEYIEECNAGVILVDELPQNFTKNIILCDDAKYAFSQLVELYHPAPQFLPGIHDTAIVKKSAVIEETVTVMPYCVIDEYVHIKEGTVLYPYVYVGKNVQIGKNCEINPGVVIHENTIIGDNVTLRAHAVIGGQGFGFATDEKGHHTHIRQIGNVVLYDDVEVGACSTIDNSTMDSTIVGRGTKIDNLVHLGHNVKMGEDCFLCAQVGVAGSTTVGNNCVLAGQAGVTGHTTITDRVTLGGKTGVIGKIDKPGEYVGFPAIPRSEWGRTQVLTSRLSEMRKQLRQLQKAVEQLIDNK